MFFNKVSTLVLTFFVGAALTAEDRTLQQNANTLNTFASNLAQSVQLPGSRPPASSTGGFLTQFPFQLPFDNIVALLNNFSQFFTQPGNSTQGDAEQPRFSIPPNPIYTTLPFNDLNITEFSWLLGNLSQLVDAATTAPPPTNVGILPASKILGNSGVNTTYADLNFLTVPQLLGFLGRR